MKTLSLVCAVILIVASTALILLPLGQKKNNERIEEGPILAMIAQNDSWKIRWTAYICFTAGLALLAACLLRD